MRKAFLFTLMFAVTGLLVAQEQGDAQYNGAQGGGEARAVEPGVAHLSLVHGDVSVQRGDSGDWVATSLNTPIVSGDTVGTSDGSRAEIQLDYGDVVRLSGQSQVKIADLSRSHIQLQVSQGYVNLSMFKGSEAEVEVDSPNVSVHPRQNGRYRIEVNSDSETNIIVREGEAEVSTPQGSTTVREGEMITVRGADDPEYKVDNAPGPDDWDQWNRQRDNTIISSQGVRHTNPYYTGTQDLDSYGRWTNVPGYGDAWSPYEQPGDWAPYQAGRWVWEPYYGWTWVSYEPWGWAPYHYGRWFYYDTAWYWWPGPITPFYRPIWAPAFVTFFGFGPHIGFGFGFGTIGWCPLAPFEVFHPWWGGGFNRFGVVAGFGGRFGFGRGNFGLAFTNARVRAGITTVGAENFGRGPARFGHGVDVAALRGARVANGNLGIVPTHESLASTNRGFRSAPAGIRTNSSGHFFSRTPVSNSHPSFQQQASRMQEAVRAHGGEGQSTARGLGASEAGRFGQSQGGGRFGNEARTDRPSNTGRTFGGNEARTDRPSNTGRTFGSNNNARGMSQGNSGGRSDGFRGFSRGSQGGESRSGQTGFPQGRNDRPSSSMAGGSRRQYDFSHQIVVPRNNGSSSSNRGYSGGNNGGRNSGGGYTGYNGSRSMGGGYPGYNGGGRNGGGSYSPYGGRGSSGGSGGYSGRSSGGYSGRGSGGYSGRSSGGSHSSGGSRSSGGRNSGGGGGHGGHR